MLQSIIKPVLRAASKIDSLPLISGLSPSGVRSFSEVEKLGYLKSQRLAQCCASEVATMLQPGWTEKMAVQLMEQWLRDHGVKTFFHKPFAWWGSRSRFEGIHRYREFQATDRRLLEGEPFILDVAPIVNGFVSDIGFSGIIGSRESGSHDFDRGIAFLAKLRNDLPQIVKILKQGGKVWQEVDRLIAAAGFSNIHQLYPFSVLGHRVHKTLSTVDISLLNFGWQSFWEISSRGIFGQLLNADHAGSMQGLWAIEPQIGGADWGAKFEEILVVNDGNVYWLDDEPNWFYKRQ